MKLCVGCNKSLPLDRFKKANPDFPTRDGRNYKCENCVNPDFRLRRLPNGKVEVVTHERHDTQGLQQRQQQRQQPVAKVPAEQDAGFANFDDDIPF